MLQSRISRVQYVYYVLIPNMILLPGLATAESNWIVLAIIYSLCAGLTFGVKRLHDLECSGLWILSSLIPLANLFLVGFLLFKYGTEGSNRFGDDPRMEPTSFLNRFGLIIVSGLLVALAHAIKSI